MGLLKYVGQTIETPRGPVQFGRAQVDGMPFRTPGLQPGQAPPFYQQAEIDRYAEPVYDFDAAVFNLRNPDDLMLYKQVFDRHYAGVYKVFYESPPHHGENGEVIVFVKWALKCLEMGTRNRPR